MGRLFGIIKGRQRVRARDDEDVSLLAMKTVPRNAGGLWTLQKARKWILP